MKRTFTFTVAAALAGMLAYSGGGFAAKGGTPGPPNNPGEESAGNRLSYPALLIPGLDVLPEFVVAVGTLGDNYSYGCDKPQDVYVGGTKFSYPNTTCAVLDDQGLATEWLDAVACTLADAPCDGLPVDRVYWQKEEANLWSAQATGIADNIPVNVRFLEWGDSIESTTWTETSNLRVETQPFIDLGQDPRDEIPAGTQLGFQMWHAEGQGINEQWGVRVTENAGAQGLPYAYQSPYAIINGGTATLYLSKLFPESADEMGGCPGAGDSGLVYPEGYPFVRIWLGTGWSESCTWDVVDYTLELSVSGKYVHGYNWRMREVPNPLSPQVCGSDPPWSETGWWRLTFVPNGGVDKMAFAENTVLSGPDFPLATPTDISLLAEEDDGDDETDVPKYQPFLDVANNLTYIDLCIAPKVKSGGGGGGGGKGRNK